MQALKCIAPRLIIFLNITHRCHKHEAITALQYFIILKSFPLQIHVENSSLSFNFFRRDG